jgi:hypothetical protein
MTRAYHTGLLESHLMMQSMFSGKCGRIASRSLLILDKVHMREKKEHYTTYVRP